jgi:hypothetical protein
MDDYLVCFLERNGRVRGMVNITCEDDQKAIERAARFKHEHVVEVWAGDHLIKRLDPKLDLPR